MVKKHYVISSSRDVEFLKESVKIVHFRKFVSRKLLKEVLKKCPNLKVISLSPSSAKKLRTEMLKVLNKAGIRVFVVKRRGRPNLLERKLIKILHQEITMRPYFKIVLENKF